MKVLFICKGNWFRSQMAAAIYNKLTGTTDASSAGTYTGAPDEPESLILVDIYKDSPHFFEVMERNGMNLRENRTVRLTPPILEEADVAVSMAEEPFIPDFLREDEKVIWWTVQDSKAATSEAVEDTYRKILHLTERLIGEMAAGAREGK